MILAVFVAFVVMKNHMVKGRWCEARKALTKEEMTRFRGGLCFVLLCNMRVT